MTLKTIEFPSGVKVICPFIWINPCMYTQILNAWTMNEPYAVYYCNNLLNFALYYITNMTQTVLDTLDWCLKLNTALLCAKWELQLHWALYNKLKSILKEYFIFRCIPQLFHEISITHSKWSGVFKFKKQSDAEFFSTQLWRCVPRLVSKYKAKPPLEFIAPFSQISGFCRAKISFNTQ